MTEASREPALWMEAVEEENEVPVITCISSMG
jgi:hypothetical protein